MKLTHEMILSVAYLCEARFYHDVQNNDYLRLQGKILNNLSVLFTKADYPNANIAFCLNEITPMFFNPRKVKKEGNITSFPNKYRRNTRPEPIFFSLLPYFALNGIKKYAHGTITKYIVLIVANYYGIEADIKTLEKTLTGKLYELGIS